MTMTTSSVNEGRLRLSYRVTRWVAWALGSIFVLLIVLYLVALGDERYEARRGVGIYIQVLSVRLSDTVEEFNRKAPGCKIGQNDSEYVCVVEPITNRIMGALDWYMMHAHEDAYVWQNIHRQNIGLRDWHFQLWVTVRQGRVPEMHSHFLVVGRDKMLGCFWDLTPEVRRASVDADSSNQVKVSTALNVTHITSRWSGWGYSMEFTPRSKETDLRMREINDSCLTSFVGCRDSRELLPNLAPAEHPRYW